MKYVKTYSDLISIFIRCKDCIYCILPSKNDMEIERAITMLIPKWLYDNVKVEMKQFECFRMAVYA